MVHVDEEPYNFATAHAIWQARRVGAKAVFFAWQNIYRVYPPPFYLFELFSMIRSHGAQAGTRQAQEVLRRKRYSRPSAVLPQFGVDAELFSPDARPADHDSELRIGYAGRLVPAKGLHVLLAAAARLSFPYRLQLIGAGAAEPELRSRAESLGIQDRVEFVGPVPSNEMPERYRAMHVCVLPSLTTPHWKEQFGRVLIEAMACGVPVVGSDSGEIPEIVGTDDAEPGGRTFPEGRCGSARQDTDGASWRPRSATRLRQAGPRAGPPRVHAGTHRGTNRAHVPPVDPRLVVQRAAGNDPILAPCNVLT